MRAGRAALVALALAAALSPQVAKACSPIGYDRLDPAPSLLDHDVARRLFETATYVDVAVADGYDPAGPDSLTSADGRPIDLDPSEIVWLRFSIVESLKADSGDNFYLYGTFAESDAWADHRREWADEAGDYSDPASFWNNWIGEGVGGLRMCESPISAVRGQSYLVFRDAAGRLLGDTVRFRWRHSGETFTVRGPVFEPLIANEDDWLRAVRRAARTP